MVHLVPIAFGVAGLVVATLVGFGERRPVDGHPDDAEQFDVPAWEQWVWRATIVLLVVTSLLMVASGFEMFG